MKIVIKLIAPLALYLVFSNCFAGDQVNFSGTRSVSAIEKVDLQLPVNRPEIAAIYQSTLRDYNKTRYLAGLHSRSIEKTVNEPVSTGGSGNNYPSFVIEPTMLAMYGLGLMGLVYVRRTTGVQSKSA